MQNTAPGSVVRLVLTDFRNYPHLHLAVDARPVVLTGANGAGKTNLVEAVSFLTPGRGLRRARLPDVTRRQGAGEDTGWAVAATLSTPTGPVEVGTGLVPGVERRVVRIDGASARGPAALAAVTAVVWLTPAMDRLFVDSASARRRFLDRLVFAFDPAHAGRVAAYEHAMRERSRLLREGRPDPAWLAALENVMAERGVAVAAARREMVMRLAHACAEDNGPFPQAVPSLVGAVETWLETLPAAEAAQRLRKNLVAGRRLDTQTGGAAEGPHRSDLVVWHGPRNRPAPQCSTGEQKALLIALVLAQARTQTTLRGFAPLLLLDEVVAHLDAVRRRALFDAVCAVGSQAWLTGTDQALFAGFGSRAQFLVVDHGTVAPVE
ncbi:MAG: DNA replication and repair protein RecF [Rhodospirillaceae bacterium]|nr:MAG: DNA replication and repair protein RecF [Rhodospirillaceae bacterium]